MMPCRPRSRRREANPNTTRMTTDRDSRCCGAPSNEDKSMPTPGFTNFDRALLYRAIAGLEDIQGQLQQMSDVISRLQQQEIEMATDFQNAISDLQTKVQADTDAENSAITLLGGLKSALDQAIAALPTGTDTSN